MENIDISRELQKLADTLTAVDRYFSKQGEMNAAGHLSETVFYSPLASRVKTSLLEITNLLARVENE
jgi:hypothetical protein